MSTASLHQASGYVRPILHKRSHSIGVKDQMQHIARTFAPRHVDETVKEAGSRVIRQQYIPVTVHDQSRERLMLTQNTF